MADFGFIDDAFVHAFENNILHLSSEAADGVRESVRLRTGIRGKTYNIERIRGVEMVEITSRHQPTVLTPFTHSRRRATLNDYGLSEVLDDIDEVKMIVSPESDYAQEFARAYNRRVAQTLYAAMTGSAITVDQSDTTGTAALPSGQAIANGSAGLTVAKVRQAARILDVNGVSSDGRTAAVSPYGIEQLLRDTQVTSSDFSTLNALREGGSRALAGKTWYGFNWLVLTDALGGGAVMASPILPKAANIRSCFFYAKNSTVMWIARDLQTEMPRDPSIWNNLRVMTKVSIGAVRVEDEAVVKVDIDESV